MENEPTTEYKEIKIGKTLYQITNVYLGQIELKEALEELTARKVFNELMGESDVIT